MLHDGFDPDLSFPNEKIKLDFLAHGPRTWRGEEYPPPRSGRKHGKHHPFHSISNRPTHRPLSRLEKPFFWNSLFSPARLPCGSPQALQICADN